MLNNQLKHKEITSNILQQYFLLHNKLGYGFEQKIYKNGLASLFRQTNMEVEENKNIVVYLETDAIGEIILDFVIAKKILVLITATDNLEIKTLKKLKNYLKVSPYEVGLLLNFGEKPEYKRRDKI